MGLINTANNKNPKHATTIKNKSKPISIYANFLVIFILIKHLWHQLAVKQSYMIDQKIEERGIVMEH